VQLLLAAALEEEDEALQESFFHAINEAVAGRDIENRVDWDRLAGSLPSLGIWVLDYALGILGTSGVNFKFESRNFLTII
jgi:hypothetical protein